eukprot:g6770.t1
MNSARECHHVPHTTFLVDGFKLKREETKSYFLSHFHSDHYTGLNDKFANGTIYCTEVTKNLAVSYLGVSPTLFKTVTVGGVIEVEGVKVYAIDANHCPGAVQFVFQIKVGDRFENYVHTGDLRYTSSMENFEILRKIKGNVSKLYLDTTYAHPKHTFVVQEDAILKIVEDVKAAISTYGRDTVEVFVSAYNIGKECIFLKLAETFQVKIHVDEKKYNLLLPSVLQNPKDLEKYFTIDGSSTFIHCVKMGWCGELWPYFRPNYENICKVIETEQGKEKGRKNLKCVMGFIPSGWADGSNYNKRNSAHSKMIDSVSCSVRIVPYSEHSNYDELIRYVRFLKPTKVVPTVFKDSSDRRRIEKLFQNLTNRTEAKRTFFKVTGTLENDSKRQKTENKSGKKMQSVLSFGENDAVGIKSPPKLKQRTLNFFFQKSPGDKGLGWNVVKPNKNVRISKPQEVRSSPNMEKNDKDLERAIELSLLDMKKTKKKKINSVKSIADSKKTEVKPILLCSPFSVLSDAFSICASTKGRIEITNTLTNAFFNIISNNPTELFPAVCIASDTLPTAKNVERGTSMERTQTDKEIDAPEQNQLGIGGSSISKALRVVLNCDRNKMRSTYKKFGDLGDVAEHIIVSRGRQALFSKPKALSIMDVYNALLQIAAQQGTGAMKKRENIMVSLFRRCDASASTTAPELRFLTRSLLRNMRINASMVTIMNCCARACEKFHKGQMSPSQIDREVRRVYAVHHDLFSVVSALQNGGVQEMVNSCQMKIGIPIDPMLAKPATGANVILESVRSDLDPQSKEKNLLCEWKYDGMRAMVHWSNGGKFAVFSRHCANTTGRFWEVEEILIDAMVKQCTSVILDCEVVAYDPITGSILPFQKLSTKKKKPSSTGKVRKEDEVTVSLVAFDILYLNGKSLHKETLMSRRKILFSMFTKKNLFQFAKSIELNSNAADAPNIISAALQDSVKDGCEGLMIKLLQPPPKELASSSEKANSSTLYPDKRKERIKMPMISAQYFAGKRSDEWRKLKADYVEGGTLCDSLDVVVIGAWNGNGRKKDWFSPFLVAVYNEDSEEFQSICRVMSGFSDDMYEKLTSKFKSYGYKQTKPDDVDTEEKCPYWFEHREVWEIRGAELSVSPVHRAAIGVHQGRDADDRGLALRFPRFIRTREDKTIIDATSSLQIAEIFSNQSKR